MKSTMLTVLVFGLSGAFAQDEIHLDQTVISGNQELPKVLYIVPWKTGEERPVPAAPPQLQPRALFTEIYPHEFRRQLAERQRLKQQSAKQTTVKQEDS